MKKYRWFISILFMGFGFFYFIMQQELATLETFSRWPSTLLIIGIASLCQAYPGRDQNYIVPGALLTGLGIHFYISSTIPNYPNEIAVITLIVAISFFLKNKRSKGDLLPSFFLLLISMFFFFSTQIVTAINGFEIDTSLFQKFWPLLLVLFGGYMLIAKKR